MRAAAPHPSLARGRDPGLRRPLAGARRRPGRLRLPARRRRLQRHRHRRRRCGSRPPSPAPIPTRWSPNSTSTKPANFSDGDLKDLDLDLPPGLIENPTAVPHCSAAQFCDPARLALRSEPLGRELLRHRPRSASSPWTAPTAAAKPGPSASSTSPRRRARPRASASLPTASRSRSPPTCAKPAANTASPSN